MCNADGTAKGMCDTYGTAKWRYKWSQMVNQQSDSDTWTKSWSRKNQQTTDNLWEIHYCSYYSAKNMVMWSLPYVCVSICLFVSRAFHKLMGQTLIKVCGLRGNDHRKNPLNFWGWSILYSTAEIQGAVSMKFRSSFFNTKYQISSSFTSVL